MPMFIATGHQGQRIVSENGADWKAPVLGKEGEVYRAAAAGNGMYVAVGTFGGNNVLSASADGLNWKTTFKDGKYKNYIRGLTFGNGVFMAIGGEPVTVGASSPFVMISKDGLEWSDFIFSPAKNMLRRITYGKNLWVAVGDRGRRAASEDGKVWKDAPESKAIDTLVDLAFGHDTYVGVGLNALRMISFDGLKWDFKVHGDEGEHLNSIVFAKGEFVAVGQGATFKSPDGKKWTRNANSGDVPATICFGNDLFVGVNWRGRIMTSPDALVWKQVHKAEHHLEAVAFG